MKGLRSAVIPSALLLASYLMFWPVKEPLSWTPKSNPGFVDPYLKNDHFFSATKLFEGDVNGPETIAVGPTGEWLYTGLRDGRIVRFDPAGTIIEVVTDHLVSPGGMEFNADDRLIVADASLGLVRVNDDGSVSVLTDEYGGKKYLFPDDIDIGDDGRVWFSDASALYPEYEDAKEFISSRPTGRLFSYNPVDGTTRLELEDLHFANGVALGPGEEYVLIAESLGYRITKLHLAGNRAGQREVWLENLPAFPDNIWFDHEQNVFWVGFFMARNQDFDDLHSLPVWIKRILLRLPLGLIGGGARDLELSWIIGFDPTGRVVHSFQNHDGYYGGTTSVVRLNNRLFVGSVSADAIARLELPKQSIE